MPTAATLAARAQVALEEATEVVADLGSTERLEGLQNITTERANARSPHHRDTYFVELVAGLAAIVREQNQRIEKLEEAAKPTAAKKSASKSSKE